MNGNKLMTFRILSILLVLCSLFIASCHEPFEVVPDLPPVENLPPDTGYFSLSVSSSRTILPNAPELTYFDKLELVFTATGGGAVPETETIDNYDGSAALPAVALQSGQYSLTVNAYKGAALAAIGTLSLVEITAGASTTGTVALKLILSQPGTTGTFSWDITVPPNVNTTQSALTIKPLASGDPAEQSISLSFTGQKTTGSHILNSGAYNVTFSFEQTSGVILKWSEYVHVYNDLVSEFSKTFTDDDFNSKQYTVTLKFNNGYTDGELSVIHGETVTSTTPTITPTAYLYLGTPPSIPSFTFDGWYTDSALTGAYTAGMIIRDTTLYAKWTGAINIYSRTEANDVEKAIAYVNANPGPGSYTLFVCDDVTIAPQFLNLSLTIQGYGAQRIIQLSGAGSLFTINAPGTTLTLGNNITLQGHSGGSASLVQVNNGTLVMETGSKITGHTNNNNSSSGGGVFVDASGEFKMDGGTISENKVIGNNGGGVCVADGGTFTMTKGTISKNTANKGGGVQVLKSTFIMEGGTISENIGGGVYVDSGNPLRPTEFKMMDGTISENTATNGGGVLVEGSQSTFTMNGGTIGGSSNEKNTATNQGGGVYVNGGTFTMKDGAVLWNNSASYGGGVYVISGNFTMSGSAKVSGNNVTANGGGVLLGSNTAYFAMEDNAEVSGNTATANGGGVYVASGSTFFMTSGTITENTSNTSGGGVYVDGGTFTMSGSAKISINTTNGNGGGVYVASGSTFFMTSGTITENTSNTSGGGVYVMGASGTAATFTMTDGTISNNKATSASGSGGGGVHIDYGTFTMNGGTISDNEVTSSGGGVNVGNYATFTMTDGTISNNKTTGFSAYGYTGGGTGGGVCVVRLAGGGGGFTMSGGNIINNSSGNGGGVYAQRNGGGSAYPFTMTGSAVISDNTVADPVPEGANIPEESRGGGVYVSSGLIMVGGAAKVVNNTKAGAQSNVYLGNDSSITLAAAPNDPTIGTGGMEIHVQTHADHDGVIVQSGATAAIVGCFTADETGKTVVLQSVDKLAIVNESPITGAGTSADPFVVKTEAGLRLIGTPDYPLTGIYKQQGDIQLAAPLSGSNWTPIGSQSQQFTGSFDGGGHTITGLVVSSSGSEYKGMFSYIGSGGKVENVALVDADIIGSNYVGGIAGMNEGTISNSYVTGSVKGSTGAGTACYGIGGIAGKNTGTVKDCYTNIDVEVSGNRAGGIVGDNDSGGTVQYCYAAGTVAGQDTVGGIVGRSTGTVRNCIALNDTLTAESGGNTTVGRIVGDNTAPGTLNSNYAWNGVKVNGNAVTTGTATDINGADQSAAIIKTQSTWSTTAGFIFSPTMWQWNSNNGMPSFTGGTPQEWPSYLQ